MAQIEKILEMMRREPGNVSFNDFKKLCEFYFGKALSSQASPASH
jgi:predicted lipoprotein